MTHEQVLTVQNSGIKAFSAYWQWNAGMFSLIKHFFKFDHDSAKYFSFGLFVCFYLWVFYLYFKKRLNLEISLLLVYAAVMFFAPVYNGWYSVWFLIFAMKNKNLPGILYACASSIGYVAWGNRNFTVIRVGEFMTHIFFIFLVISCLKVNVEEDSNQ